ncbi:hypothetical protein [Paenarthrobacter aromaticivorans]|uniref:hypothetical protein n=1 Tax=Paenarthrobacter aromaticivorans TaxID=2849150 RepID=UPI003A7F7CA3
MPQDHVPEFVKDKLLPVQSRRTDGVQDDFDIIRGKPESADRTAVKQSGSFNVYWTMPDSLDNFHQTFQIQVSRKRQ